MATESSFSWNFDTGTFSEARSLQETVEGHSGYDLPMAACLPPSVGAENERYSAAEPPCETDRLLNDNSDKV